LAGKEPKPGRDERGYFTKGNKIAKGNPHAKKVAKLRAELLRAVSPEDIREVCEMLKKKAFQGDMVAIKELLDRVLGRALVGLDLQERIDQLEKIIVEQHSLELSAADEQAGEADSAADAA